MKIAEVIRLYSSHRIGGMPIKSQIFSEALVQQGHEVHVLTTSLRDIKEANINGVYVHYLDVPSMQYGNEWWDKSNRVFQELHKEVNFDILHSESYAGYAIQTDIPKFATFHGTGYGLIETCAMMWALGYEVDIRRAMNSYRDEIENYSSFDKLIAVSKKEERVLKQKYFHKDISLIYNPVNWNFFEKNWVGDEDYYFSYGINCTEKGIKILVDLSKKLKIKYAGNTNPGGDIEYLGPLSQEEITDQLVHCKGFINPTLYCKGFDLTTCEALSVGVPCFVSFVQADEDLSDNDNCILINPADPALHRKIISISENVELRKQISKNAKFFAMEYFHPNKVISNFLSIV